MTAAPMPRPPSQARCTRPIRASACCACRAISARRSPPPPAWITRGGAVILIDADLQDPPEVIPRLVAAWRQGYDMVYAQRRERCGEAWLKRASAAAFYRLMRNWGEVALPEQAGDFRLMSRAVVGAVLSLRERHRFMKGVFAWVGFRSCGVPYSRAPRSVGHSKWSYWKLWNLALEAITSFSVLPLKLSTYLGLGVALFAAVFG